MHISYHEEINLLEAAQDGKLDFIETQLANLKFSHLQQACKKIDYYGRNALHYASFRGHYEVVAHLLDLRCIDINSNDKKGNTALMLAAVKGYNTNINELKDGRKYKICKLLMDRGASLQNYSKNGINNPLHWTCYFGDLKTTKLFLEYNPYLMLYRNDQGYFPIDYSLMRRKEFQKKQEEKDVAEYLIIKFLVHFLGSLTHKDKLEQLNQRIESMDHESVFEVKQQRGVKPKSDFYKYEKMGSRYLFWASILGNVDLVESLLQFNFSPFEVSYKGRSAVHAATYNGHLPLLRLFFESDMTINKRTSLDKAINMMTSEDPQTALHIAVQRGVTKKRNQNEPNEEEEDENAIVGYLLSLGADLQIFNFRNHRALDCTRGKRLRQHLIQDTKKKLVRSGYNYLLVGYMDKDFKNNLLLQQLKNIQEKNLHKGRFKFISIQSIDDKYIFHIVKVDDNLMNEIADEEGMIVYNVLDGILVKFNKQNSGDYENFHNIHIQSILLKLMYDEFDLDQFMADKLLVEHYPLHDQEEKQLIYKFWMQEKWYILREPFSLHRNKCRMHSALASYYGAEVGFFFVFLCFFTSWLIIPAIPGIMIGIYVYISEDQNSSYVPIYIIFLAVWATIFFEFWKRKQSETAFLFDMHIAKEQNKMIPQYKGEFTIEEVEHVVVIRDRLSPQWKYIRSAIPLIILAIIIIGGEFVGYYYIIKLGDPHSQFYQYAIAAGYGGVINLTNEIFNFAARRSLAYENHQYEDDLENSYILKAFSFAFVNSFSRLFYSSLIEPDSQELQIMVVSFSVSWAVIHLFRHTFIPFITYQLLKIRMNFRLNKCRKGDWKKAFTITNDTESKFTNRKLDSHSSIAVIEEVEANRILQPPPDHVAQFTYFIIQFSLVTMFSANAAIVPIFLLIFNFINMEGLLYGYMNFVKRPIAAPKISIGMWNNILLVVGYIGTIINCLTIYTANSKQLDSLVGQSSLLTGTKAEQEQQEQNQGLRNFLYLIAAEHIVLGIKFIIESVIPDEPDWVLRKQKRQEDLQKHLEDEAEEKDKQKQD